MAKQKRGELDFPLVVLSFLGIIMVIFAIYLIYPHNTANSNSKSIPPTTKSGGFFSNFLSTNFSASFTFFRNGSNNAIKFDNSANTQTNKNVSGKIGTQTADSNVLLNHAPAITSSPTLTVNSGKTYTYQLAATDADNDPLTYSFVKNPGWLSISSAGLITGTASTVNSNTNYNVNASVSDGKTSVSQAYVITVNSASSPPSGSIPPPPPLPS